MLRAWRNPRTIFCLGQSRGRRRSATTLTLNHVSYTGILLSIFNALFHIRFLCAYITNLVSVFAALHLSRISITVCTFANPTSEGDENIFVQYVLVILQCERDDMTGVRVLSHRFIVHWSTLRQISTRRGQPASQRPGSTTAPRALMAARGMATTKNFPGRTESQMNHLFSHTLLSRGRVKVKENNCFERKERLVGSAIPELVKDTAAGISLFCQWSSNLPLLFIILSRWHVLFILSR